MPLLYTGPADIIERIVSTYRGALPGDIASTARTADEAYAIANMVALSVEGDGFGMAREARLSTSHGIWTDQHAVDRGTRRQEDEDDPALIERLKTAPKAVTYSAIYAAIDAVLKRVDPAVVWYLIRIPVDLGAFADTDAWCDADSRVTHTRTRMTIAIIPVGLDMKAAVLDALREKMPAGHAYAVEEY